MNQVVAINNRTLPLKEYNGQRVVTFKEIDFVHDRPNGTASRNFKSNKKRFIEGEDYFQLSFEEVRETNFVQRANSQGLTLLTKMGYLFLQKILKLFLTLCACNNIILARAKAG